MRSHLLWMLSLLLISPDPTRASMVDHSSPHVVAHTISNGSGEEAFVLLADGTVWSMVSNFGGQYERRSKYDPPVAISQILFWAQETFVTTDGHVYIYAYAYPDGPWGWADLGPVPIGPISTDQQGVGSMKSRYKTQQKADEQE